MGWTEVDNKIKKKIFSFFVSCTEAWELDFIKEVIMEEVPDLNEEELSKAMMESCKEIAPPRPRTEYLKYLRYKLELEPVHAEE